MKSVFCLHSSMIAEARIVLPNTYEPFQTLYTTILTSSRYTIHPYNWCTRDVGVNPMFDRLVLQYPVRGGRTFSTDNTVVIVVELWLLSDRQPLFDHDHLFGLLSVYVVFQLCLQFFHVIFILAILYETSLRVFLVLGVLNKPCLRFQ
jgi:hypothetical protein